MIEKAFRTYFWVFILFFLGSSSYLLAYTTSNSVRILFPKSKPNPLMKKDKGASESYVNKRRAEYVFKNNPNVFDPNAAPAIPPKAREPEKKTKKDKKEKKKIHCDPNGQYRRSKLPLELKGTVIASDPNYSVAAIYDARRRKLRVLRTGDTYLGIKICLVEVKAVRLDRGVGRLEYLELGAKAGRMSGGFNAGLRRTYRKLRRTNFDTRNIVKKGNGRYKIPRDFLTQVTQRLDVLASQAAIVPYFKGGRAAGFRLYRIRRGSLYEKIGLKNGDVIKRINGYEFTSPQKALEAYSNLTSQKNLNVEVFRGGKRVNMNYEVTE